MFASIIERSQYPKFKYWPIYRTNSTGDQKLLDTQLSFPNFPEHTFPLELLAAIFGNLCFAISNVYWIRAGVRTNAASVLFNRTIITCGVFVLATLFLQYKDIYIPAVFHGMAWCNNHLLYCIGWSLFCACGLICFVHALRFQSTSATIPLSAVNVFGLATAILVWKQPFLPAYTIGMLLGLLGVYFLAKPESSSSWKLNPGFFWALAASMFWGIGYAMLMPAFRNAGLLPVAALLECMVLMLAFSYWFLQKRLQPSSTTTKASQPIYPYFILAACVLTGSTLLYWSIAHVNLVVLNLISSCNTLFAFLLGWIWLRERTTSKHWIGAGLISLSIWLTWWLQAN
jgi:drug/metabolite transporter (DMT)-like permease